MPKKSAEVQKAMRTLIIDNGSKYLNEIEDHVNAAAKEQGTENEVVRLSIDKLQEAYKKGNAEVVQGYDYVISSGSGKYRKYDTEMHEFIANNLGEDSVFLGVCHGAQQYAQAHGAKLKKTEHMHHGNRKSKVNESKDNVSDPVREDIAQEGEMTGYGHHKWYIPVNEAGSNLEVIAEAESKHTGEKFVEMYKVIGKDHYGVQYHPEKGDGSIIKTLFKKAAEKKGSVGEEYQAKTTEYKKAA